MTFGRSSFWTSLHLGWTARKLWRRDRHHTLDWRGDGNEGADKARGLHFNTMY